MCAERLSQEDQIHIKRRDSRYQPHILAAALANGHPSEVFMHELFLGFKYFWVWNII